MTIASDFTAYQMATKQLTVTTTSTLITGSSGLAGEAIPADVGHLALIPESGEIYWAFGTASASTVLIKPGGVVFNAPSAPALRTLQLYSPTGAKCQAIFGGPGGRVVLGDADSADAYDAGEPFVRLIDDSAATTALADPAPAASKAEVIDTAAHGVINTRGKAVARIMFGGTDAANKIINYQVILWSQSYGATTEAWIPRVVAKGVATLGDDVYSSTGTGLGAATNFFADTITDTILDGATVYRVAEQRAVLEIPLYDAERVEVQTDLNDAVKADCFIQLGNASAGGGVGTSAGMFYEDEAHASGDTGRMFLAVRTDSRASLAGTTGDYAPPQLTANGDMRTRDDDLITLQDTFSQAANSAYAAGDKLRPLGGVKSVTRHTAAELETFADDDYVPVGVTGVHELRVRDDDANTDWDTLLTYAKETNIFSSTGKAVTDLEYIPIAEAAAGVATIHADESGHHFYLMGFYGTGTAAGTAQFREADDSPTYTGAMNYGANGGLVLPVTGFPYLVTASGKGFEAVFVGAGFNGAAIILDITE